MAVGGQPGIPTHRTSSLRDQSVIKRLTRRPRVLRARDVQLYKICEDLTECLIYGMVVFGPWAFGTTQSWSIWAMNGAGYLLGLLLICKLWIRWVKDYHPPRWGRHSLGGFAEQGNEPGKEAPAARGVTISKTMTGVLAASTVGILAFCLISALNARSTFHRAESSFTYHSCIQWLPHSLDSVRTWQSFWNYLGLACAFWAMRDWLLGTSADEVRPSRHKPQAEENQRRFVFPTRLRRLLWVLAINGGLLGLESIVQRLEGSGKLLFLVKPHVNPTADTQFGPYAYRANASQYFNLLWPVCLGFWWVLHQAVGVRHKAHHLILVSCGIMAACPIISTSRGGAMITIGALIVTAVILLASLFLRAATRTEQRQTKGKTLLWLLLFLLGALSMSYVLGWKALKPRMARFNQSLGLREQMYQAARPMVGDYPYFGTGPGTFETVFQHYRVSVGTYWPAQLHNDWLETRITFGWVGSSLIALAFLMVVLRWFARGGIEGAVEFVTLVWLSLGGCLLHARFDFPFQIYSILFLFLSLCAVISVFTRKV